LSDVTNDPEKLTDAPGAYLLLINIERPVDLPRRFAGQTLAEGYFGYAGSAYGPGGIRARCRRHLGKPSTLRWHVDWLTTLADNVQALALPGGTECRLIEALVKDAQTRIPIPGFGSTDCKQCPAHLVEFDRQEGWDASSLTF